MRTVLMISRCFPPLLDVGGKRAYHFAKYLPLYGWRAVVLTSPIPAGHPVDTAAPGLQEGRIERVYHPRWWPQPHLSYTVERSPIPEAGATQHLMARLTSIPIGKDIWLTPRVLRIIGKLAQEEPLDAIFATSGPTTALLEGWMASKLNGLPLCLDLRDPWSLNFLQRRKPAWIRAVERRIEHFLFRQANRVIFNSEDASRAYQALYPQLPRNRITTITNSFDPARQVKRQPPEGPVTLVHFGNCNGLRSLATVIRALARMRDDGLWPTHGMRLLNLGRVRASDVSLAAALELKDAFEYQEATAYDQGLAILGRADLQILLGYGDETLYIPAKTYDYLLTGRPVLCLARPCVLTECIEQTNAGRVVEPDDVAGAIEVIKAAIAARNGGPPVSVPQADAVSRYDARYTSAQLARLLDEIVSERKTV